MTYGILALIGGILFAREYYVDYQEKKRGKETVTSNNL